MLQIPGGTVSRVIVQFDFNFDIIGIRVDVGVYVDEDVVVDVDVDVDVELDVDGQMDSAQPRV